MTRAPYRHLAALAALALVTACGGGEPEPAVGPAAPAAAPTSAAAASTPAPVLGASPTTGTPADGPTVLTGVLGSAEDPDAFEITLTDEAGEPVEQVPAGDYRIEVKDPSKIHNFHLKGAGVDETTTVPEVVDTSFDVTLTAGEYTYICDPHPRMVGTFSVV